MFAVGLLGIVTMHRDGFEHRVPPFVRDVVKNTNDSVAALLKAWRWHECFLDQEDDPSKFIASCDGGGKSPLLLLWGDSLAAALYPGIKSIADSNAYGVAQFTTSGCPPWASYENPGRKFCKESNEYALAKIRELKPEIVLIHSASGLPAPYIEKLKLELKDTPVKKIALLGQLPVWLERGLAENIVDYEKIHRRILPQRTDFRLRSFADRDRVVRKETEDQGLVYVSAWDAFCNRDGCLTRAEENAPEIFFWGDHLTMAGSMFLATRIAPYLFSNPAKSARDRP